MFFSKKIIKKFFFWSLSHKFLTSYAKQLDALNRNNIHVHKKIERIVNDAWGYISDYYNSTTLCLQWEPNIIAISMLQGWWYLFWLMRKINFRLMRKIYFRFMRKIYFDLCEKFVLTYAKNLFSIYARDLFWLIRKIYFDLCEKFIFDLCEKFILDLWKRFIFEFFDHYQLSSSSSTFLPRFYFAWRMLNAKKPNEWTEAAIGFKESEKYKHFWEIFKPSLPQKVMEKISLEVLDVIEELKKEAKLEETRKKLEKEKQLANQKLFEQNMQEQQALQNSQEAPKTPKTPKTPNTPNSFNSHNSNSHGSYSNSAQSQSHSLSQGSNPSSNQQGRTGHLNCFLHIFIEYFSLPGRRSLVYLHTKVISVEQTGRTNLSTHGQNWPVLLRHALPIGRGRQCLKPLLMIGERCWHVFLYGSF